MGGSVGADLSHNVTFKSDGSKPSPRDSFTFPGNRASPEVRSKDLNGEPVSVVPSGGGFDTLLNLVNTFGSPLTGDVTVYANSGFPTDFTLDDFDTLRGARTVFSAPFSFAPNEGLLDVFVCLNSLDEYILITGNVDHRRRHWKLSVFGGVQHATHYGP